MLHSEARRLLVEAYEQTHDAQTVATLKIPFINYPAHRDTSNFRHRFTQETIEAVFRWILEEAGSAGMLTPAEYRFLGETVPEVIAHGGEVRQFLAQCISQKPSVTAETLPPPLAMLRSMCPA